MQAQEQQRQECSASTMSGIQILKRFNDNDFPQITGEFLFDYTSASQKNLADYFKMGSDKNAESFDFE